MFLFQSILIADVAGGRRKAAQQRRSSRRIIARAGSSRRTSETKTSVDDAATRRSITKCAELSASGGLAAHSQREERARDGYLSQPESSPTSPPPARYRPDSLAWSRDGDDREGRPGSALLSRRVAPLRLAAAAGRPAARYASSALRRRIEPNRIAFLPSVESGDAAAPRVGMNGVGRSRAQSEARATEVAPEGCGRGGGYVSVKGYPPNDSKWRKRRGERGEGFRRRQPDEVFLAASYSNVGVGGQSLL